MYAPSKRPGETVTFRKEWPLLPNERIKLAVFETDQDDPLNVEETSIDDKATICRYSGGIPLIRSILYASIKTNLGDYAEEFEVGVLCD